MWVWMELALIWAKFAMFITWFYLFLGGHPCKCGVTWIIIDLPNPKFRSQPFIATAGSDIDAGTVPEREVPRPLRPRRDSRGDLRWIL
jgi:hypothetical protein